MLRCALRLGLALALLVATWLPAVAQEARGLPPGMNPAQYDAMIEDIARSVAQKLQTGAQAPKASQPAMPAATGTPADAFSSLNALFARAGEVLAALPDLGADLARLGLRIEDGGGDRTAGGFALLLLAVIVLAVALEKALRGLIGRLRGTPAAGDADAAPDNLALAWRVIVAFAVDLAALIPVWIVFNLATNALFTGPAADLQRYIAAGVLSYILMWRLTMVVMRAWFRPSAPALRIALVDDADARRLYYTLTVSVLVYMLSRVFIGTLVTGEAAATTQAVGGFINNLVYTVVDLAAIWVTRHAGRRWLMTLVETEAGSLAPLRRAMVANWVWIGVALDIVASLAHAYGVLSGRYVVGAGITLSMLFCLALIFLEALLARVATLSSEGDLSLLAVHAVRFVTWVVAAIAVFELWAHDVLDLIPQPAWSRIDHALDETAVTICVAFLLWQAACYWIDAKLRAEGGAPAGQISHDEDAAPTAASRLHTMLPLARRALGVAITVLTLLLVLSGLGVNIAPLIAGASILGLAISFGSQTLVKDIVSGIFYLADDAFRVGEYIDTGRAKGTVEGFTLRSIKLRHQNGQLHTIPFGQLGSITNYSRDWITMKFNMRLARDTDVELVRKTTKKIGLEMLSDEEVGSHFLDQLKMQGVVDVVEGALIVRFKFTSKPGKPTYIQRLAIKRMMQRFAEVGIQFATGAVQVQTVGDGRPADLAAAGGGAAAAALRQAAATPPAN
jgi:small-conductance mechanosensitive channel